MLFKAFDKLRMLKLFLVFYSKSVFHGRSLKPVINNLERISSDDIVLFCVFKNEAHRLDFFLKYYRSIGVNHFVFVDNDSTDELYKVLSNSIDVTVFFTNKSYKKSNFGMHWLNYLLRKHGAGHWCFTCDPDEFLVYPEMDSRDLKELAEYLSSIREESFFTCMVDMYGDKPVDECLYEDGTDPVLTCGYFDGLGYVKTYLHGLRNIWLQGGVRRRVFSRHQPQSAPALNKVPLIKWKWYFAYVESMHMAIPRRLNESISSNKVTGALLHFKFISQLKEKVDVELKEKQHFNDSAEYKQYADVISESQTLFDPSVSEKYDDWRTLAKLGLINKGEW